MTAQALQPTPPDLRTPITRQWPEVLTPLLNDRVMAAMMRRTAGKDAEALTTAR